MAIRSARICSCGNRIIDGQRCACQKARKAEADRRRPGARQRGYDAQWERQSKEFLELPGNQWCACGCGRLANVVDHKIAPKGDKRLFWHKGNWQPMHSSCNTRKAIKQEGGFGRSVTT